MPKSKKSSCVSCETCATRKTSTAKRTKAADKSAQAAELRKPTSAKAAKPAAKEKTGEIAKLGDSARLGKAAKSAAKEKMGEIAKSGDLARLGKAAKPARRPNKSEVPPERLCEFCDAKCCRYFALPIDKPATFEEFDYVRWYLLHERASVFVENGDWFLLVHTPCKELGPDNRCQIYETRPQICREYSTTRCEYDDLFLFEQYFETPEQVEEYAVATLGPRPGADEAAKSAKPEKSAAKKTVKKEAKTAKGRASTKKSPRRGA